MRKGKLAGQVAHASQRFLFEDAEWSDLRKYLGSDWSGHTMRTGTLTDAQRSWAESILKTKIVAWVNSEAELNDLIHRAIEAGIVVHPITDAGLTEFHGVATLTCAAFGPDYADKLDKVTGHLSLL